MLSLTLLLPLAHSFRRSAPNAAPRYTLSRLPRISRRPRSMDAPPHGLAVPPIWQAGDTVVGFPAIRKAPVLWGSPHAPLHGGVGRRGVEEIGSARVLPADGPLFWKSPDHFHPTHWHSRRAPPKGWLCQIAGLFLEGCKN